MVNTIIEGLSSLKDIEKEVLELTIQGLTSKEIAKKLFLSEGSTKKCRRAILEKTNTRRMAELIGQISTTSRPIFDPSQNKFHPNAVFLTDEEKQVLVLLAVGYGYKLIAEKMHISKNSAIRRMNSAAYKLGTDRSIETAVKAIILGIITIEAIKKSRPEIFNED